MDATQDVKVALAVQVVVLQSVCKDAIRQQKEQIKQ